MIFHEEPVFWMLDYVSQSSLRRSGMRGGDGMLRGLHPAGASRLPGPLRYPLLPLGPWATLRAEHKYSLLGQNHDFWSKNFFRQKDTNDMSIDAVFYEDYESAIIFGENI